MKKTLIAFAVLLAASTVTFAHTLQHTTKTHKTKSSQSVTYTCKMHPEIIMNKPGKCPKCGMTLVKVKTKKPA